MNEFERLGEEAGKKIFRNKHDWRFRRGPHAGFEFEYFPARSVLCERQQVGSASEQEGRRRRRRRRRRNLSKKSPFEVRGHVNFEINLV